LVLEFLGLKDEYSESELEDAFDPALNHLRFDLERAALTLALPLFHSFRNNFHSSTLWRCGDGPSPATPSARVDGEQLQAGLVRGGGRRAARTHGKTSLVAKAVNQRKADRLPHEAGLKLLAVPRRRRVACDGHLRNAAHSVVRVETFLNKKQRERASKLALSKSNRR